MNAERRNGAREPIRLSDHFSYGRLIRFTMPTIIMMIFTSIYGVVDGLFVSMQWARPNLRRSTLFSPLLWYWAVRAS